MQVCVCVLIHTVKGRELIVLWRHYLTGSRTGMCPHVKKGSLSISLAVGLFAGLGRSSFDISILASGPT